MSKLIGSICQIIGPVVDVSFDLKGTKQYLPKIHEALEIDKGNGNKVIVEIQQHIGEDIVRTVAMDSTDGLRRGMKVVALGSAISMKLQNLKT